jgi:hypothetical protein
MIFETCACCEVEYGKSQNGKTLMEEINPSIARRVKASGIGKAYDQMTACLVSEDDANAYDVAFANAMKDELFDENKNELRGLLKNCKWMCRTCIKALPADPEDEIIFLAKRSLIDDVDLEGISNFYFFYFSFVLIVHVLILSLF